MKAYNLMGYDAFTPGELDFSCGVGDVIRMSEKAKFPFLLANLRRVGSRTPVFPPYLIKKVGGMSVGVFGLLSRPLPEGPPEEKGKYYLQDPIAVARKIVSQLKEKKCQVIILLGHMEAEEQEALARAVPHIDFLFSGHVSHFQTEPVPVDRTQILRAGSRGEELGWVEFREEKKERFFRYELTALTPQYPDEPTVKAWTEEYKQALQKLPPSPQKAEDEKAGAPQAPSPPLFIGAESCRACHPRQHQGWLETPHARAYQTLVGKNKTSDANCLACHTTGFTASRAAGASLKNVQCEACHGPGEGHPERRRNLPRVSEKTCRSCHNPANSPQFDYSSYLPKIRHP